MATLKETIELFQGENCYGTLEVEFEFNYDADNEEFVLGSVCTFSGDEIEDNFVWIICDNYFVHKSINNSTFRTRLTEAWESSQ